jgi:hypothetical protein
MDPITNPNGALFGGGALKTQLHPIVAVLMLIAIALILALPRSKVIVAFLIAFFTIPIQQVILIGPLHFPVLRVLILVGLIRTLIQGGGLTSKRRFPGGFNRVDMVVILWILTTLVFNWLQWTSMSSFVKLTGDFLDSLGAYLVLRYFIPDLDAFRRAVKALGFVCLIHGAVMVSEQFIYHNPLVFLGVQDSDYREGHIRSEGIMGTLFSGTFAGALVPLFVWLSTEKKSRKAAAIGLVGALAMALSSHASTAILALMAGALGLCCWPLRTHMRIIRYGIAVMLAGLHIVMHGPVWSLIEKIDLTGGSSNYHRYMLVDNTIRHFSQWWMIGYPYPGAWGFDMWDLCDEFVVCAITGGLLSLALYVLAYSWSFGSVGKARKRATHDQSMERLLWCLGSAMFANFIASFGINYMIQLQVLLFTIMVSISAIAAEVRRAPKQSVDLRLGSARKAALSTEPAGRLA